MSILIKGMKMPKNCVECRFCVNGFTDAAPMYECACESYENVSVLVDDYGKPFDFRPDWCPLIELPEKHGRLIDERVAYDKIAEQEGGYYMDMDGVDMGLSETPTIIEAEGDKE